MCFLKVRLVENGDQKRGIRYIFSGRLPVLAGAWIRVACGPCPSVRVRRLACRVCAISRQIWQKAYSGQDLVRVGS